MGEYGEGDEQPRAVEPVEELPTDDVAGDDARQMAWTGAFAPQRCPCGRTSRRQRVTGKCNAQHARQRTCHTPRSAQRAARSTHGLMHAVGERSAPTKSTFRTSICVPMREPNGDSANGTDPYLSERKAAQIEADSYGARATGRSRCLR